MPVSGRTLYGACVALLVAAIAYTVGRLDDTQSANDTAARVAAKYALAQRRVADSLRMVADRQQQRLVVTRYEVDTLIEHHTVVMPPPDLPVVPRHVVDAAIARERRACDSTITARMHEAAARAKVDSAQQRAAAIRVEPVGVRRVSLYAQPMWEPLTQTPVMEGGATVRLFRRVHLVASAEQRFAIGESPRLRLGMRAEF